MNTPIPITQYAIPLVDDCLFIDNSAQERIQTCARSAGFYLGHKREGNKPRTALSFGKNLHSILEERYRNHGSYLANDGVAAMVKVADQVFDPAVHQSDPDDYRNYGMAIAFIRKYASQYPMEDFEIVKFADGTLFVERPFAIPLGTLTINAEGLVRNPDGTVTRRHISTITIVQKGRIDLAYRREGYLYGMDHKSTSIMGNQFFAEFELSSQVHGYSWAIEKLVGELPRGFVINGLGIRKPTKTGNALEFVRQTIPIWPALVAEWKQDTLQLCANFIRGCITGQLPKETKWCVGKYGPCEYKPVCGLEPQMREMSLYSNEFRDVEWDPLKND